MPRTHAYAGPGHCWYCDRETWARENSGTIQECICGQIVWLEPDGPLRSEVSPKAESKSEYNLWVILGSPDDVRYLDAPRYWRDGRPIIRVQGLGQSALRPALRGSQGEDLANGGPRLPHKCLPRPLRSEVSPTADSPRQGQGSNISQLGEAINDIRAERATSDNPPPRRIRFTLERHSDGGEAAPPEG